MSCPTACRSHPFLRRTICWLAVLVATISCDREDPPKINNNAVVRCEQGVRRAQAAPTLEKASQIYYQSCASIHSELACRSAYLKAAKAKNDEQMKIVAAGCKKAYCPILGAGKYELCSTDFDPTPDALQRAWPPFHSAIVARDAAGYAGRVNNALLAFYATTQRLAKKEEEEQKPDAAGATRDGAAPPGSAAPSGSAAPALSGSAAASAAPAASARPRVPKPKASAK